MVLSVEAKCHSKDDWEIYTDCGRERSGLNVIEWVKRGIELSAGEIMLTSIDQEGTLKEFDIDLLKAINAFAKVPVIISSGYVEPNHLHDAIMAGADGVAFADALHYKRASMLELRSIAAEMNVKVRMV